MSWFSQFMHPGQPYKDAANVSGQYYNQAQGAVSPYANMGGQAGNVLQGMLGKLNDPAALQNEWVQGYEQSPYAKQLLEQSKNQGMDLAQSMGLGGSSTAIQGIQANAGNIVNQDRQQYLNDLMDKYKTGVGLGQNIYGIGANAAGQMGQNAMNQGNTQAGLAYGQGTAGGNMFGQLGGLAGGALGSFFGPVGSAVGSGLGKFITNKFFGS